MNTTSTTTARDKLRDAQQRAGDLRSKVAQLWATAESGGEVDAVAVTTAEAELSVADRLTPTLTRLAQAEVVAEQNATWQGIETDALAEHRELSANFHDALDAARAAVAALVEQAVQMDQHAERFRLDQRRPPTLGPDGITPQERVDRSRTTTGGTIRGVSAGDVVASLAADGLDQLGGRDTPMRAQLRQLRTNTTLPADNRK